MEIAVLSVSERGFVPIHSTTKGHPKPSVPTQDEKLPPDSARRSHIPDVPKRLTPIPLLVRHGRTALTNHVLVSATLGVLLACGSDEKEKQPVATPSESADATGVSPTTAGTGGPLASTGPVAPTPPGSATVGPGGGTDGNGTGTPSAGTNTDDGTTSTDGSDVGTGGDDADGGTGTETDISSTEPTPTSSATVDDSSGTTDATDQSTDSTSEPDDTSGEPTDGSTGTGDDTSGQPTAEGDLCDVGVWDGSEPQPLSLTGNTFAHDPTMVEANGTFYRFWTGDRIPSATSTDLLHWEDAPTAYTGGYPSWVNEWLGGVPGQTFNFPWAPDVSYFNDTFHLYSSFSAKFGDNISCITHLTSDGPTPGNWTDHGPVICTQGNEPYNAIDADVALDTDGNPYFSFGSFWDGIMAFPLNADGSRKGNDITRLAWAREIEAPVLLRRCGYYYLFVTWGLCCPGEGRSVSNLSYRVAVGRSENILGPYVDREGRAMLDGGGTLLVQGDRVQWAAAGHSDVIVTGSKIYHYYHAYRQSNGQAQLRIVELPFDDEGWPVPGGP